MWCFFGGLAEWSKAPVLKTGRGATPSRVRIPDPPPPKIQFTPPANKRCVVRARSRDNDAKRIFAIALLLQVLAAAQFFEITSPDLLAVSAGLSVTLVTVMAATLGATIPLVLHHFKVDPAVATGAFITTGNDIFDVMVCFFVATSIYLDHIGTAM